MLYLITPWYSEDIADSHNHCHFISCFRHQRWTRKKKGRRSWEKGSELENFDDLKTNMCSLKPFFFEKGRNDEQMGLFHCNSQESSLSSSINLLSMYGAQKIIAQAQCLLALLR